MKRLALTILLLMAIRALAQYELPPDNVFLTVMTSLDDGTVASGLFIQTPSNIYFVTAKHVLFNKDNSVRGSRAHLLQYYRESNSVVQMKMELNLEALLNDGMLKYTPSRDVAMFRIGSITTNAQGGTQAIFPSKYYGRTGNPCTMRCAALDQLRKYDDVMIGNDVYVLGYPASIGIKEIPQIEYDKPLLRKGAVAGKNEQKRTIIIDCPTYYGNSGGPVLQVEREGNVTNYRVIGIVTEFIPFQEEWENKKHKYFNYTISNSGYSVIEPIDVVMQIIE
jgi:hypothetical protein